MGEEVCHGMKRYSLQINREGDDANVIFSGRQLGYPGVAIKYKLQKKIRDITVCIDFKILEVHVLVKFSGT